MMRLVSLFQLGSSIRLVDLQLDNLLRLVNLLQLVSLLQLVGLIQQVDLQLVTQIQLVCQIRLVSLLQLGSLIRQVNLQLVNQIHLVGLKLVDLLPLVNLLQPSNCLLGAALPGTRRRPRVTCLQTPSAS
ncbi:unnamed protein product [Effrenium voratum]|uniref:Uncharacterized protein n=1 Tax=Effrenium voratum TaxID=2562239 RepID=A0AA36J601_9DINO|nr:unnamed protein product [Effrenium voratum]